MHKVEDSVNRSYCFLTFILLSAEGDICSDRETEPERIITSEGGRIDGIT
jgi:hypothetical protein